MPDTTTARDQLYDALVVGDGRTETRQAAARLLDAYRAEVLREAAEELHRRILLADDCACVAELRRMAAGGAS